MSNVSDLWPTTFPALDTSALKQLLQEQAVALAKKTDNALVGEVDTYVNPEPPDHNPRILKQGPFISLAFYIKVPVFGDYRYRLFTATHGAAPYPVLLSSDGEIKYRAHNEDELIDALKKVLGSEETLRVIQSLLQLSVE